MAILDITSDYIVLQLSKGITVIFSLEDADLTSYKWVLVKPSKTRRYAQLRTPNGSYLSHRIVLERIAGRPLKANELTDHINGDGLDNRRSNLRIANASQNMMNQRIRVDNISGFKGVTERKELNAWTARIHHYRNPVDLGLFDTAEEAAIAYNHAAVHFFGEFAVLNDIPDWENKHPIRRDGHRLRANNTTGYSYITFESGRWRACIRKDGKTKHVGRFDTIEEAIEARNRALTSDAPAP